ncbi:PAB-dependent poly(A)-specific ribonuclease subunit 3, partial [Coemansia furcata]
MAHVVGNLNKLDAGSSEKVMLMSRDEKSCLVVSYEEVKRCVEEAYQELIAPTQATLSPDANIRDQATRALESAEIENF